MKIRNLKCDQIVLNDPAFVNALDVTLKKIVNQSKLYDLRVENKLYFKLDEKITTDPGWYLIFSIANRLYVGKADDLNGRLNTHENSLDNFANPKGPINNRRNFIKKLYDIGYFKEMKVLLIDELTLCTKMKLESPLSDLDRRNVEKFINVTGIGCGKHG